MAKNAAKKQVYYFFKTSVLLFENKYTTFMQTSVLVFRVEQIGNLVHSADLEI